LNGVEVSIHDVVQTWGAIGSLASSSAVSQRRFNSWAFL
jgi:hypothetical protein